MRLLERRQLNYLWTYMYNVMIVTMNQGRNAFRANCPQDIHVGLMLYDKNTMRTGSPPVVKIGLLVDDLTSGCV